jgi:hypothetical protein
MCNGSPKKAAVIRVALKHPLLTHTHLTLAVAVAAAETAAAYATRLPASCHCVLLSPHTHASHSAHMSISHRLQHCIQSNQVCPHAAGVQSFYQQSSRWAWAAAAAAAAPHLPRTPCCTARRIPRQVFKQHPAVLTAAAAALHSRHCSPVVAAPARYSCAAQQ